MIRVLLPIHTYHSERVKLAERITAFQLRKCAKVKRACSYLEKPTENFLEGFLENEVRLPLLKEMLTNNPIQVMQSDESFPDMSTILIEDSDEINNIPY